MRVRVRFRYDPATGQVETFQVDDVSTGPPRAGHDAEHDRVAAEIAGVIEPGALIEEIMPGGPAEAPRPVVSRGGDQGEDEGEQDRHA